MQYLYTSILTGIEFNSKILREKGYLRTRNAPSLKYLISKGEHLTP